jgi:aspartyl protease family protein
MQKLLLMAGMFVVLAVIAARQLGPALDAPPAPKATIMAAGTRAPAAGRTVMIPRDSRGHFQVNGRVDGKQMAFMVDTGASVVALTESDAARLGIRPALREFTTEVKTANGTVRAARARLNRVEIADVIVRDVAALVVPDKSLNENLLGLSFLSKLRRFEYANGKLLLEQ